jgi:hypothetical protein
LGGGGPPGGGPGGYSFKPFGEGAQPLPTTSASLTEAPAPSKQKSKQQAQKLQSRHQKILEAETEMLRAENGFEYDPEQGKWLQEIQDRKVEAAD